MDPYVQQIPFENQFRIEKIPVLGDIPVIGGMFRRRACGNRGRKEYYRSAALHCNFDWKAGVKKDASVETFSDNHET